MNNKSTPASARSCGSGVINLGMMSFPVKFYLATVDNSLKFNLIHLACNSRVKQHNFCPSCKINVPRLDLGSGYQDGDTYRVFNSRDLITVLADQKTKTIQILSFGEIDKVPLLSLTGKVYYLGTDPKQPVEAYQLLHSAMNQTNKVGIVRYVTARNKLRYALLQVYEQVFLLMDLHFQGEIRNVSGIPHPEPSEIDTRLLDMACQLVIRLSRKRPTLEYTDTDSQRILAYIKQHGALVKIADRLRVIHGGKKTPDIMSVIKESLKAHKKK